MAIIGNSTQDIQDLVEKKNDDLNEENDETKTDKIDDDASKKTTTGITIINQNKFITKSIDHFNESRASSSITLCVSIYIQAKTNVNTFAI